MANIKLELTVFNQYIINNGIEVNNDELAELNSIFKECDIETENGEKGADNKLTGDEVRTFFSKLSCNLKKLIDKYLIDTNIEYAEEVASKSNNPKADNRGIQLSLVTCERTQEEQVQFKETLEKAKSILIQNKDMLALTDEEIKYINSATTESVNFGAARYDRNTGDCIKFNMNNSIPSQSNLIKILLHEVNHAVIKSEYNSQAEERECETKAIVRTYLLYEQGLVEDAPIYQSQKNGNLFLISDFKDEQTLANFIDLWLDECNYRGLPEE